MPGTSAPPHLLARRLQAGGTHHREAQQEQVGARIREHARALVVFLPRCVPQAEVDHLAVMHHRHGAVVEDRWRTRGVASGSVSTTCDSKRHTIRAGGILLGVAARDEGDQEVGLARFEIAGPQAGVTFTSTCVRASKRSPDSHELEARRSCNTHGLIVDCGACAASQRRRDRAIPREPNAVAARISSQRRISPRDLATPRPRCTADSIRGTTVDSDAARTTRERHVRDLPCGGTDIDIGRQHYR